MQEVFAGALLLGRKPPLGVVPDDLQEAEMLARIVLEQHHLAAGPEARAVLLQMPALVVGATGPQGVAHLMTGTFLRQVFRREEAVGRMPLHLVGRPAENPLRPGVPIGDLSVGVGRQDGEVERALEDGVVATATALVFGVAHAAVQPDRRGCKAAGQHRSARRPGLAAHPRPAAVLSRTGPAIESLGTT